MPRTNDISNGKKLGCSPGTQQTVEYDWCWGKHMHKLPQAVLFIGIVAAAAWPQSQDVTEIAPATPSLVPQDFTVDDGPVTITVPFQVFVDGKLFQGRPLGWHLDRGSTMWLGLPGHGMYVLSLVPRAGYNFQEAGAIRDRIIAFESDGTRYEIRTSGPVAGPGNAWRLYVLHLPEHEMKGPLFGIDRLGSCTLAQVPAGG